MNDSQKDEVPPFPAEIINAIRSSYEFADERRRKGFYTLFMSAFIFGYIWATSPSLIKLPIINIEVALAIAMLLAPCLLLITFTSYLYLCSHTVLLYTEYISMYWECHNKSRMKNRYTFLELHSLLKRKDITEQLNPYLIFRGYSKKKDSAIPRILSYLAYSFANIFVIVLIFVPAIVYLLIAIWLVKTNISNSPVNASHLFGWAYIIICPVLIVTPTYFYFRVKGSRSKLKVLSSAIRVGALYHDSLIAYKTR